MDEQCDQGWLNQKIMGVNHEITEAETRMETAKVNLGSLQSQQKELDKLKKEIAKACADYGLQVEALQETQGKMQAYLCDMEKTLKDCVFCFSEDVCKAMLVVEKNLDCKERNLSLLSHGVDYYCDKVWDEECKNPWDWNKKWDWDCKEENGRVELNDCTEFTCIEPDEDEDEENKQNCGSDAKPVKSKYLQRLEHELAVAKNRKQRSEEKFKAWKNITKTINDRFKQMEKLKEEICLHIKKREYAHAYYYLKVSEGNFSYLLNKVPNVIPKDDLNCKIMKAWEEFTDNTGKYEGKNEELLKLSQQVKKLTKEVEALRKSRESDVLACLEVINKKNNEASHCVPDKPQQDSPVQQPPRQDSPAQQSPRQDSPVQQTRTNDSKSCNEPGKKE